MERYRRRWGCISDIRDYSLERARYRLEQIAPTSYGLKHLRTLAAVEGYLDRLFGGNDQRLPDHGARRRGANLLRGLRAAADAPAGACEFLARDRHQRAPFLPDAVPGGCDDPRHAR